VKRSGVRGNLENNKFNTRAIEFRQKIQQFSKNTSGVAEESQIRIPSSTKLFIVCSE
jgi:hypothetical protein